jgi:hypothetical protein
MFEGHIKGVYAIFQFVGDYVMKVNGRFEPQPRILILAPVCGISIGSRPESVVNMNRRMVAERGDKARAMITYTNYPGSLDEVMLGQVDAMFEALEMKLAPQHTTRRAYVPDLLALHSHFVETDTDMPSYVENNLRSTLEMD